MKLDDVTLGKLLMMLRRHEGERLTPYTDTSGKITIGIGRNLTDVGISRVESDVLFQTDVNRALLALLTIYPEWFLTQVPVRQAALVDMMFNLGPRGFAEFRGMIGAFERGDPSLAAIEMVRSVWARQVGGRAQELAAMVRTAAWIAE
jgi:lysozyme